MSINAEVSKSGNESTLSTIRKFSRRVQGTGLVKTVRGSRYYSRSASKTVKKKRALKRLKRRAEYRKLVKEGKIIPETRMNARPFAKTSQTEGASQSKLGETTPIAR
ncbi:MAG: hypothetical protein RLZZ416_638 [Candidatus Parcubacteria bacterium]|jgi:ribosomal protein S21